MDYEILRKLNRAEYIKLRGKVRGNILINSKIAEDKRGVFRKLVPKKPMIVGGLILEKKVSHSCSLYREGKGWECVSLNKLIENPSLTNILQSIETRATIVLFDFSGIFTVMFSPPPMAFTYVKEGDIIYATGSISPMIFGNGQGVFGTHLLTEEEMDSYKEGTSAYQPEEFSSKDDVAEIKKSGIEEDLSFLLDFGGSSLEVLHHFLKEISHTKGTDLFWIVSAIYDTYSRYPSERLYSLVKKYFYQFSTSQYDMETEDKTEHYLQSLFPRKHLIEPKG